MSTTEPTPTTETPPQNNVTNNLLLEIHPVNFLSFGPDTQPIPLKPLNVLIGANGSGKSNLLEAIAFMRATPDLFRKVIQAGGGADELIWKGEKFPTASVELLISIYQASHPFSHKVEFESQMNTFFLAGESISTTTKAQEGTNTFYFYEYDTNFRSVRSKSTGLDRKIAPDAFVNGLSILNQLRDPSSYPEITYVAQIYNQISMYRDWSFGSGNPLQREQLTGLGDDRLDENFDNLALYLNKIELDIDAWKFFLENLKEFYDGIDNVLIKSEGSSLQVIFQENGFNTRGIRLSDGTVRYLCLLAILCDPKPPRLICIEEPELGLHPDVIPSLAKLLLKASERTQLIITTHSDILVECFSEYPEYVMVCEKHKGQTQITRLDPDELKVWLDKYKSLGDLWTRGHIGGNRW